MQITTQLNRYEALAALLDYPTADYPMRVADAVECLQADYPQAAEYLRTFIQALPPADGILGEEELDEIQEIFTRSFDVQSITTLGVGYVVFGDDYKRGELLVNLNRELRAVNIDTGTELSDHLPTVLRLVAKWTDEETKRELAEQILHPAIDRMIGEFTPGRIKMRETLYKKHYKTLIDSSLERGTMFRAPLAAVLAVLIQDFALPDLERVEEKSVFLECVVREMEIEKKSEPKHSKRNRRRARREPRRLI
jgi:nitrate reductase assembly molybdenum cofactor insertion protein NarJ